ncbi:TonB system transport protein ExbD [Rhodoligotrophos defluvii]|uniref:TonB system transport protein ExbD n=1 Tax=Rhodoligotrophos defluvii TaxID=2561934 RepID=UPI0010C9825B|nr:TonB system transport protein ExbD [Rhodoligotrophos defluvii]
MAARLDDSQGDDLVETHEINVTPFIDVMLVLLIIFMVAAPLATVDVPVDLPTSNAAPQERPDKPVFLSMQPDLSLVLGNDRIPREELAARLNDITQSDREQRIFLRADKAIPYGDVMDLMNEVRQAGYSKIGLVQLQTGAPVPQD